MFSLLLAIIYLAFISLGLPDSLLGSAWPVMRLELNADLSLAGIITMLISGNTIISSLLSDRMTKKFGANVVTAVSAGLSAVALFGFSVSNSVISLCLWSIPFGLGAGAIDAALNNYVAVHYTSRHMSWLHCFWGLGASISPYIMSYCLSLGNWRNGYLSVSVIQIVLAVFLFATLPLWKNAKSSTDFIDTEERHSVGVIGALKIKGVPHILIAFFCYCAFEATAFIWTSTYLVEYRGMDENIAAGFASLFYIGLTVGRFLCGFISDRIGDKNLIRYGSLVSICALIPVMLPWKTVALVGIVILGLGCAPIYPSIIHATPYNFGKENSQAIVGIQMASAYVGSTFIPPIFGLIADHISAGWYPYFILFFAVWMFASTERLNKILNK